MKFERLTVIKQGEDYVAPKGFREARWWCLCDCQLELPIEQRKFVLVRNSRLGKYIKSCGCLQKEKTSTANKRNIDLSRQAFGRLTVLRRSETSAKWVCQCECGNITEVTTSHLRSGHTKSCGCLQKERALGVSISLSMANI